MAVNMAVYDAVLKEVYGPQIEAQLVSASLLLQRLQRKGEESLSGREFVIPIHVSRNVGIAARGEEDDLPEAGAQGYRVIRFEPRMLAGSIQLTEKVIQATRNDTGAFVRALRNEIDGLIRDWRVDVNRQLYGDGKGLLATVTGGDAENADNSFVVDRVKYLQVGQRIDLLVKSNGTAVVTNRKITAIDPETNTVTVDGAAFTDTVDGTVGVYDYGAYDKELHGFGVIFDDEAALHGLSPADEPLWAANVFDNGGTPRAISELLLQEAWDKTEEMSGQQPDMIITTYGVRRAYQDLLVSLKRFVQPMQLEGGYTALEYNGKPFVVDRDCPPNTIFLPVFDYLAIYQYSDPGWLERDGAVLKQVPNKAAWRAYYVWFADLATSRRNAQTVIKDVQEA